MPKATGATDGEIRRATPTGYPLWSTDTPFNGLGAIGASTIRLADHATGFSAPLDVVASPDATGSLYVVEQAGRVRAVRNGTTLTTPFLDLGAKTTGGGERGLLGLAFHPNYAENGRFFVYYTQKANPNGAIAIAEYARGASPDVAVQGSGKVILTVPHPGYSNHNGGMLAFGPDGFLYAGTGDGGGGGDPDENGQDVNTKLGKILRIDVDSKAAGKEYNIPSSNPFAAGGGAPEVFILGVRNPVAVLVRSQTGDLWIGDVGQSAREEADLEPVGTAGGRNYGWRTIEGTICTPAFGSPCPPPPNYAPPVFDYDRTAGGSITGGFRYRGNRIPALAGAYLYGDFVTQRMWAATTNGQGGWTAQQQLLVAPSGIASFGEDVQGGSTSQDSAAASSTVSSPPTPTEMACPTGGKAPTSATRPLPQRTRTTTATARPISRSSALERTRALRRAVRSALRSGATSTPAARPTCSGATVAPARPRCG